MDTEPLPSPTPTEPVILPVKQKRSGLLTVVGIIAVVVVYLLCLSFYLINKFFLNRTNNPKNLASQSNSLSTPTLAANQTPICPDSAIFETVDNAVSHADQACGLSLSNEPESRISTATGMAQSNNLPDTYVVPSKLTDQVSTLKNLKILTANSQNISPHYPQGSETLTN